LIRTHLWALKAFDPLRIKTHKKKYLLWHTHDIMPLHHSRYFSWAVQCKANTHSLQSVWSFFVAHAELFQDQSGQSKINLVVQMLMVSLKQKVWSANGIWIKAKTAVSSSVGSKHFTSINRGRLWCLRPRVWNTKHTTFSKQEKLSISSSSLVLHL
jgi:hypothetical protein